MNKVVFCSPTHEISSEANKLLVKYQLLALTRYVDKAQKPYDMKKQLSETEEDVYLLVGDQDLLFPYQRSIGNAQKHIQSLKEIKVFKNVAHGIETYNKALNYVGEVIKGIRIDN